MKRDELMEIGLLNAELNLRILDLKQFKEQSASIAGVCYDNVRVQSSVDSKMDRYIVKVEQMEKIITDTEKVLNEKKREMDKRLRGLDFKYYRVLRLRYVNLLDWQELADEIGISIKHAWNLHGEGLKRIERL